MRCFRACFSSSSPGKLGTAPPPVDAVAAEDNGNGNSETLQLLLHKCTEEELGSEPFKCISICKDKKVEQEETRFTGKKKKVTFDLPTINPDNDLASKRVTVSTKPVIENIEKDHQGETLLSLIETKPTCNPNDSVAAATSPTHKQHHQNCAEGKECEDLKPDVQNNFLPLIQDESSESLFSLSIDSRKRLSAAKDGDADGDDDDEKEVTSSLLEHGSPHGEVKPTGPLPIHQKRENETLTKLESSKARPGSLHEQDKENIEVAVDVSLSSWLVKSEATPTSSSGSLNTSPSKDRTILGAISTEESNCRRLSRMRNPKEMLVIGTVGSYWRHTGRVME